MKRNIQTYIEFINEAKEKKEKFSDMHDNYIDTDYQSSLRDNPQRYRNDKSGLALNMLKFIYSAGEKGRKHGEVQRFFYEHGGKERSRTDYTLDKTTNQDARVTTRRGFDSVKDRGMGSTMLSGGDYWGRQTGILNAHCEKNDSGRWVLTDSKLKSMLDWTDALDGASDNDLEVMKNLF